RVLAKAEFVVQVAVRTAIGRIVDQRQARRSTGNRIDTGIGVVLLQEQRGTGTTHGDGGGQRQRVAASVTEHLQRGITAHVPGEAQTRRKLVVDIDVRLASTVLVVEVVPTQTEVGDEVVGDAPAVFDIERGLIHRDRRAGLEGAQAHHGVFVGDTGRGVAAVAPDGTTGVGFASDRLKVVDVDAATQQ